jgi:thiamine pyrophosphate-dependent acetolactate synthase large subunit-like protein
MQAKANVWVELRGRPRMADLLVTTVAKAGTVPVFAMPAESLNSIVDAIRKHDVVQLVGVRHEGTGALMASAYAKLTGRLGVCMGTAGPGASHLPVGTYDASADRVPLLAVTGQVPSAVIGSGSFQEIDAVALFRDSTTFNRLVASARQTAVPPLACASALHRRAAAHLAFPSDVLASPIEQATARLHPTRLRPRPVVDETLLGRAAGLLGGGQVVVLVGAANGNVQRGVEALAARLGAPVLVLPEGMHYFRDAPRHLTIRLAGEAAGPARMLLRVAKQVLLVGPMTACVARVLPPSAQVVQVAPESEVGRRQPGSILRMTGSEEALLSRLGRLVDRSPAGWLLRESERLSPTSDPAATTAPFWKALDDTIPTDAVVALEPGLTLESAFLHLPVRDRTITSSFGFGARGYALPAAIAAAIALPRRAAVAVASEDGLAEVMSDLLTAKKYGLPVTVVCLEQPRDGSTARIDFRAYGDASGVTASRAHDPRALAEALAQARRSPVPALVCATPACVTGPAAGPPCPRGERTVAIRLQARHDASQAVLGEVLTGLLVQAGIDRAYGRPRPALEPLLRRWEEPDAGIVFVPAFDPESASMMASAYSKWTGRPGVCIAADGADLLAQLNGFYDAAFDGNPMVIVTGADTDVGQDGPPPIDAAALLADVAATSIRLEPSPAGVLRLQEALWLAVVAGKVVHVTVDFRDLSLPSRLPGSPQRVGSPPERLLPAPELLDEAAARLLAARRAAILVGRGGSGSREEIEQLASFLRTPIVTTMPGRGVIPDDHPHMAGAIGSSGHWSAHRTLERSDTVVALGVSARGAIFDLPGRSFLIQVDSDPLQLDRRAQDGIGLYGTVRDTLQALLALLPSSGAEAADGAQPQASRERFLRERQRDFGRWCQRATPLPREGRPIPPSFLCRTLQRVLADAERRPIVTVDVGLMTMWVYRHLVGRLDFVWTSSFATMGFALPAALAIAPLEPERPVVAVVGDGGIGITMAELAGASRAGAPVTVVVFNNGKLGAIKYEQEIMGWPEYGARLCNCDFAEYARACGVRGVRVTRATQLEPALRAALACGEPCLIDVVCDPHEVPRLPRTHPRQYAGYLLAVAREAGLHLCARGRQRAPGRPLPPLEPGGSA